MALWGREGRQLSQGHRDNWGRAISQAPTSWLYPSPPRFYGRTPPALSRGKKPHSIKSQHLRQVTDLIQGTVLQAREKILRITDAVQSAGEVLSTWWLHTGPRAAFTECQLRSSSWEQPAVLNPSGMLLSSLEIIL